MTLKTRKEPIEDCAEVHGRRHVCDFSIDRKADVSERAILNFFQFFSAQKRKQIKCKMLKGRCCAEGD